MNRQAAMQSLDRQTVLDLYIKSFINLKRSMKGHVPTALHTKISRKLLAARSRRGSAEIIALDLLLKLKEPSATDP